jgi:protein-disulfide isomerase
MEAAPAPAIAVAPAAIPAPAAVASSAAPAPVQVPAAEGLPRLDAATIARTRLHEGPSQGPADAPVTVVVFSDMQCGYCGDALGSLDQLQEDFSDKLRIVVKQMPVHKTAELAAEAALAAEAQGKFWELHDRMLAQQDDLSLEALLAMGKQAGLDVAALRKDLTQHTYAKAVEADMKTAQELELNGTPAFVINGQRVQGNQPIARLRALVSEALTEAQAAGGS